MKIVRKRNLDRGTTSTECKLALHTVQGSISVPEKKDLPDGKGQEQTSRTAIQQSPSNLHIQSCTDRASDTNQLDMSRSQLSMCLIISYVLLRDRVGIIWDLCFFVRFLPVSALVLLVSFVDDIVCGLQKKSISSYSNVCRRCVISFNWEVELAWLSSFLDVLFGQEWERKGREATYSRTRNFNPR